MATETKTNELDARTLHLLRRLSRFRSGPRAHDRGEWVDTMLAFAEEARAILKERKAKD